MTSIDEIFSRQPGFSGNKRKGEPLRDPNKTYKAPKLSTNGDVKQNGQHQELDQDESEEQEDTEAGPELPPSLEETEPQDDEEGRFFGGGVNRNTADVLDFIEERDKEDAVEEKYDSAWLRRLAVSFERKISKNSELRAKFEADPQKFMGSEADLDIDIKGLSILAEHPELYAEFAKLGCAGSLVSLLAHENTDIAIDAIEIIAELTAEDVEADQKQWDALVDVMLDADLPSLLVENLKRLDETQESDRSGVYLTLSIVENLASKQTVVEQICESSDLLKWLLDRTRRQEPTVTQNQQYAAEIQSILLQSSTDIRALALSNDTIDLLLQQLSAYRKKDPEKNREEEEYVENLFDALTCLVEVTEGKRKYIEAEGVELALIMLREGKFSKPRSLRLLDHAMLGAAGVLVSERFVEAAGLKTLFGMFMKQMDHSTTEHTLGIFESLLRSLPGDSPQRIRTLAKFMEKDYEKVRKLVLIRSEFRRKLDPVDDAIRAERTFMTKSEQDEMEDVWLSRRLDVGLFCVQTIDTILAWLVAEDVGAKQKISELLKDRDESLDDIKAMLKERLSGFDKVDDVDTEMTEEEKAERADAADMMRTLIDCLS